MTVANKLSTLFVPKPEGERFKARKQSDWLYRLKQRFSFVALFQMIIRDAWAEMVNVVEADVAGKPLQYLGQFVERAAFERRCGVIPIPAAFPIDTLKLMLHVKKPHARRARSHCHH